MSTENPIENLTEEEAVTLRAIIAAYNACIAAEDNPTANMAELDNMYSNLVQNSSERVQKAWSYYISIKLS